MTTERLSSLIELFASRRIGIIGDFFLDKYLDVDQSIAELSLETGKIAHQVVKIRCSPGAAGNIVNNLSSLGTGAIYAIGFIGDDGEAYDLDIKLKALGCNTDGLFKIKGRTTPAYIKPRDIHVPGLEGEHERYDIKNRIKTPQYVEKKIIESLDSILPELDALIIADQVENEDCGVITGKIRNILSERALEHTEVAFFADSRSHILLFRNIIIKPNQFELTGIENPSEDDEIEVEELKNALSSLRNKINAPVFV
ncbi:MAG TPA: carbohydrate kinase, partial [bacterium]|nr:carbohydrate kinase [bacterium]